MKSSKNNGKNRINGRPAASALALALCAVAGQGAQAVEAGGIVVYSHLSEPLSAAVALSGEDAKDPADLGARVAGPEAYAAAGVKRPDWADSATVKVERADKDRLELKIVTPAPVESPASSLIIEIEVKGSERKLSKEFAVILDPAEEPKVSDTAAPRAAPKAPEGASKTGGAGAGAGGSMVVKQGQVLSAIAQSRRPADVSVDRMMIGLLRANPGAFVDSNINRLKAGAILRMPGRPELEAIRQAAAVEEVNRQAGDYARWRAQAVASVEQAEPRQAGSSATGRIGKVEAAPETGPDVLKLGKAEKGAKHDAGSDKAEAISKQKELDEARAKVRELEKMRDDLQKLLTVRDKQLADSAAQAKEAKEKLAAQEAQASKKPAQAAADAKGDAKDAKPDMKGDAKDAKPDMKGDAKDAKPDMKGDAKDDSKDAKVESKEDSKPEAKADSTDAKPEASSEEPKAAVESKPETKPEPAKAKPVPAPAPAPVQEPSLSDQAMGYAVEYGPYAGGAGILALLAGWLASKSKGRKRKMMATTINPESARGESRSAAGEPPADEPTDFEERINSADTYIAFDQPEKAVKELEEALRITPNGLEALIRLARIAAKSGDRGELGRVAGAIGDATFRAGPYWEEAESLMSKFDKPAAAEQPAKAAATELPVLDLEKGLMELAGGEPAKDSNPMDFGINVASEPSKPAAAAADTLGMEMNFDLPAFDAGSVSVDPPKSEPEPKAPERQEESASFESLSFDLGLPDDKPTSAAFELGSESMDFNVPAQAPAEVDDGEGELRTMLELAKAYMDMGDRDGSKELLDEIAASASPALAKQAKDMLAKL